MNEPKKRRMVNARKRAEQKLYRSEAEANEQTDLSLVFNPVSPMLPVLEALRDAFVAELEKAPLPDDFSPPIARGAKRSKASLRNAENLLANLLSMKAKGRQSLSVSLRRNTYGDPLSAGYVNLIKLAAHHSRGLAILKEGFRDPRNPKNSRLARLKPTRKFRDLINAAIISEHDFASEPKDLIELRTKNSGKRVTIPRTEWERDLSPETAQILEVVRLSLEWFNLVLHEYEISFQAAADGETRFLYPSLYAVYTDDFEHGGRFYTARGGHQSLTKAERRSIKFNGHPTVELDFGGLHVRMLYHLAGDAFPLRRDPYAAVLDVMGKNAKAIFADHPAIRDDLKVMLLALVNGTATSQAQAVHRANWRLFHGNEEDDQDAIEQRIARWRHAGILSKTKSDQPSCGKVQRAFRKAHQPIKSNFSSGCGLYLQNLDAQIARWVMFEMMVSAADECVPMLPVHDSFITFEAYRDALKTAMEDTYQHVMGQQISGKKALKIPVS